MKTAWVVIAVVVVIALAVFVFIGGCQFMHALDQLGGR
jgi:uncharacterized protein YneF (UPF0154 family)